MRMENIYEYISFFSQQLLTATCPRHLPHLTAKQISKIQTTVAPVGMGRSLPGTFHRQFQTKGRGARCITQPATLTIDLSRENSKPMCFLFVQKPPCEDHNRQEDYRRTRHKTTDGHKMEHTRDGRGPFPPPTPSQSQTPSSQRRHAESPPVRKALSKPSRSSPP